VYKGLIFTLAKGNSVRWERLKGIIKTLDDYDPYDLMQMDDENRKLLYKYLGFSWDEMYMDGEIKKFAQNGY